MINCIVAVEHSQGIGMNNSMPWPHLAGDMQLFKKVTTGNVIIMGSSTWKSLPVRPLKNRINVVLSRSQHYVGADHTFNDPDNALTFCLTEYPDKEIFIIGGSEIYNIYLSAIDNFYVTEIGQNYNCDKFFNLEYVKNTCSYKEMLLSYTDPVNYTINLYKK